MDRVWIEEGQRATKDDRGGTEDQHKSWYHGAYNVIREVIRGV